MTHQPKPILTSAIANPIADLLGGWPTPEKYIHQLGWFSIPNMMGKSSSIPKFHGSTPPTSVFLRRMWHIQHHPTATSLGPWIPWMNLVGFRPVGVQVYGLWSGWWLSHLPLWKMMEFVSWDDDIPKIWNNKKCSKPSTRAWISWFGGRAWSLRANVINCWPAGDWWHALLQGVNSSHKQRQNQLSCSWETRNTISSSLAPHLIENIYIYIYNLVI